MMMMRRRRKVAEEEEGKTLKQQNPFFSPADNESGKKETRINQRERESGAGLWINGSDGSASDPF
jgi:hypothetical protein